MLALSQNSRWRWSSEIFKHYKAIFEYAFPKQYFIIISMKLYQMLWYMTRFNFSGINGKNVYSNNNKLHFFLMFHYLKAIFFFFETLPLSFEIIFSFHSKSFKNNIDIKIIIHPTKWNSSLVCKSGSAFKIQLL